MEHHARCLINGAWATPSGEETLDVYDSTTGKPMATIQLCGAADAEAAVRAARAAADGWAATPVSERARLLEEFAGRLAARTEELSELIARETGMPVPVCRQAQVGSAVAFLDQAAEVARTHRLEEALETALVVREPVGVVVCITAWNFPIAQVAGKSAFALAAGNTVVLKPSELAPLSSLLFAEVARSVGFPPGVLNVVIGTGPVVGEALVSHPDVDMVTFTGSTRAGRRVSELATAAIKRVTLELGGKSANVLLDDLDDEAFDAAVARGVINAFFNCGQICSGLTRMLVPRSRLERAEAVCAATVAGLPVGDPFAAGTAIGPLSSSAQVDRVQSYIQRGLRDGARLVAGGPGAPDGVGDGFYVRPTVFSDVAADAVIAQEEIFGPVLVLLAHDNDDEAVQIANSTVYGLYGAVSGADQQRAVSVARRLRAGQVQVNGGAPVPAAPFGGYKQSGLGREGGHIGFEEFMETKALLL